MSKIFTKNWIGEERRSRDGYIFDFWIKLSKWLKRKVDIGRKISNCISILVKGWNIEMKWFKIARLSLNILWRKKARRHRRGQKLMGWGELVRSKIALLSLTGVIHKRCYKIRSNYYYFFFIKSCKNLFKNPFNFFFFFSFFKLQKWK